MIPLRDFRKFTDPDDMVRMTYAHALGFTFVRQAQLTAIAFNTLVVIGSVPISPKLAAYVAPLVLFQHMMQGYSGARLQRIEQARWDFVAQRWPRIEREWPHPMRRLRAVLATPEIRAVIPSRQGMPEHLQKQARLAAMEAGLRSTILQPFYDSGKAVWKRAAPLFSAAPR